MKLLKLIFIATVFFVTPIQAEKPPLKVLSQQIKQQIQAVRLLIGSSEDRGRLHNMTQASVVTSYIDYWGDDADEFDAYLVQFLTENMTGYDEEEITYILEHLHQGAHIMIPYADLYDQLIEYFDVHPRYSSHYKDEPAQQYALRSKLLTEVLFGTATVNGQEYTWLQAERNPVEGIFGVLSMSTIRHILLDFVEYRITGENIGPMGRSIHTEHGQPLFIFPESSAGTWYQTLSQ